MKFVSVKNQNLQSSVKKESETKKLKDGEILKERKRNLLKDLQVSISFTDWENKIIPNWEMLMVTTHTEGGIEDLVKEKVKTLWRGGIFIINNFCNMCL
jgi:hypothetical protein